MTRMVIVAAAGLALASCGSDDDAIVVFAASSLTDVLEAADEKTDLGIEAVLAGSTTLVAQLREGADADVLVTADRSAMDRAVADGSVAGRPQAFATNTLVLAVAPGNPAGVTGLEDLADQDLAIGLCAAEVPCGALARSAARALGATVAVDTEEPNVRALAAKITLGEVDAGLLYRTDALALGMETVAAPELDAFTTQYLVATVDRDPDADVRRVVETLLTDAPARSRLSEAGFGPAPGS